jgi:hypothetical protein
MQLIAIDLRKTKTEPEQENPERHRERDEIPIEFLPDGTVKNGFDEAAPFSEMK